MTERKREAQKSRDVSGIFVESTTDEVVLSGGGGELGISTEILCTSYVHATWAVIFDQQQHCLVCLGRIPGLWIGDLLWISTG